MDVIVGFVGNVALKISKDWWSGALPAERIVDLDHFAGELLARKARQLPRKLDYAEYGGAPFARSEGVAIVGMDVPPMP